VTNEALVLALLDQLKIPYTRYEHPAVSTVEEAMVHWEGIEASHFKNLFLRNQKGDRHYLVVVSCSKRVDLQHLAGQIGDGKLSFASPERLRKHLGLTPGAVSPFGLINDGARTVRVFLDADLAGATRVSFHPNVNTATLVINAADFQRFLESCGNQVRAVSI
jgi:Ala-tRNA(Pro) deacylase